MEREEERKAGRKDGMKERKKDNIKKREKSETVYCFVRM